jgi:RNase P subunit RPR2
MRLLIKKQIGKKIYHFELEGANLYELVSEKSKLSFPDKIAACGKCASEELDLRARKGKNEKGKEVYEYVFIKCLDCNAELVFGHRVDNPDVFYLRKKDDPQNPGKRIYDWVDVARKQTPDDEE